MVIIFTQTANMWRRAGAYRIATALRSNGIEVQVIEFLNHWNIDTLLSLLDKLPLDWVGFSATYSHYGLTKPKELGFESRITDLDYELELKLISFLKSKNIPMLVGGSNVDVLQNRLENFYLLLGQGDNAVIEFHNHIVNGSALNYTTNKLGSKILYGDDHFGTVDLGTINIDWHDDDFIESDEILPIEISRGCIFKCKFCQYPYTGKKPGTYIRPKEKIKEEIVNIYHKHGIKRFLFQDDTFNDSVEKMEMIRDIRNETGIPFEFWAYGRLELFGAHPKMIDLLGETGWVGISCGIETMNRKSGSLVGKGANPEKQKILLKTLRERYPNLHIGVMLIVGLPHNTKEEIKETIDWLIDNNISSLKLNALHIKNSKQTMYTSLFDKNPEKYGFTIEIHPNNDNMTSWKNNTWTQPEAKQYAKQMQRHVQKRFFEKGMENKGWTGQTSIARIRNRFELDENFKWTKFNDGAEYIAKKTNLLKELIKNYETRRIC